MANIKGSNILSKVCVAHNETKLQRSGNITYVCRAAELCNWTNYHCYVTFHTFHTSQVYIHHISIYLLYLYCSIL